MPSSAFVSPGKARLCLARCQATPAKEDALHGHWRMSLSAGAAPARGAIPWKTRAVAGATVAKQGHFRQSTHGAPLCDFRMPSQRQSTRSGRQSPSGNPRICLVEFLYVTNEDKMVRGEQVPVVRLLLQRVQLGFELLSRAHDSYRRAYWMSSALRWPPSFLGIFAQWVPTVFALRYKRSSLAVAQSFSRQPDQFFLALGQK